MSMESPDHWLQTLPLDEPVVIDGETVFLRVQPEGAELGVYLAGQPSDSALADAMRVSFQSAREFEAGLGWEPDAGPVLSRWIAGASGWHDLAEPLEQILNQLALWRAAMSRAHSSQDKHAKRDEERFYKLLSQSGGMK
ncbi:hypothetical protein RB25_07425 [Herbaspirillum rubrisubalbicans]|uniref:hypothetical protein n=1 Tax=Herbaspirillum rubrisubalbicans TaxID=80842 RepID=UPI000DC435C4|nr:hypothetical protein [Herbaspirillum rubrisubalbicans]RAN49088.1 hypothetical protein RB25_07425 [Herbaspirillum rubrisubalbicans]